MKKYLVLIMSIMIIYTAACGSQNSSQGTSGAAKETSSQTQAPAKAGKVVIKINNELAAHTVKGESWLYFKKVLTSKVGDKVDVQIYDNGTLYNQTEQIQALQQNNVQLIAPVPGVLTGQFPKLAVFGLPYLFRSPDMISQVINDQSITTDLFKEVEEKNAKIISVWLNGWRMVSARKPVNNLEEMKKVKIRVPGGANYVDTFKALGANVVTLNWSEVPTSLQQGVIDAAEPTPNANYSDKLYEVAPYITKSNHMLDIYVIVTNKKWLEGLPADIRKAVEETVEETQKWNWERTTKANVEAMDAMQKEGAKFIQLSDEELKRWEDATKPVLESYKKIVSPQLIDKLVDTAQKFKWDRP
jgi:C4-dicarboxylate-binding protein DctP